jgi:hypothetical protein
MSMMKKDGVLYRYYFKHEPEWTAQRSDKSSKPYGASGRTLAVIEAIEPDPNCVFHCNPSEARTRETCTCKLLQSTREYSYCSLKEPQIFHQRPPATNARYDPIVGRREAFRRALDAKKDDGIHIWSYELRTALWHSFLADVRQPLTRVAFRDAKQRTYGRIHVQV